MQPRFPPPTGLPPAPGAPRPMFQPPPQFMPPGAIPPPHGMMHGMPMGMHPGMGFSAPGMVMHPGQMNYGMPPPQFQQQYQVPPPAAFAAPPRPTQSVIVGAPVLRTVPGVAPAPPAPLPLTPAPTVVISATSAIHDFNFSNPAAVFMNATSSLLNKVIFTNPAAALPLTVYIGQVPLDMSDQALMKVLEVCGKIFKFTRPVDPSTTLPTPFALVTYSQAICAARCVTALHNYVVDAVECVAFVVKAGTKETAQLESILKTEQEAAAQLPEGYSLDEGIYGPIRTAIDTVLAAANGATTTAVAVAVPAVEGVSAGLVTSAINVDLNGSASSGVGGVSNESTVGGGAVTTAAVAHSSTGEVEAGEITEASPPNTFPAATTSANSDSTTLTNTNYYHHLDTIDSMVNNINATGNSLSTITAFHNTTSAGPMIGEDGEVIVDEAGEKMLMSEIEKFRLRQMQRDKEVEEERKRKIKQKMQELKLMQQYKAEREARAQAEGLNPSTSSALNNTTSSSSSNNTNAGASVTSAAAEQAPTAHKRSVELSAEELEAKRQRKLQVLQMLSGGGDDEPTENNKLSASVSTSASTNDLTTTTPGAADITPMDTATTNTSTSITNTAANVVKKISIKNKLPSTASKSTFGPAEEDELKPVREIVKLEYTQEELNAMQSASNSYTADNDYHTDYDFGSGKKHAVGVGAVPSAPVLDMSTLQALALAKAQALSLALKSSTAAASASASAPVSAGAESKTEQDKLKSLVDKIPTARDELFAYPIGWSTLSEHNILSEVMNTWVSKKITEHLGEEEPSLVEFIMGKLSSRCSAADLLEELSVVLDEAAEPFVLKLWRMLVYYTVKNQ